MSGRPSDDVNGDHPERVQVGVDGEYQSVSAAAEGGARLSANVLGGGEAPSEDIIAKRQAFFLGFESS